MKIEMYYTLLDDKHINFDLDRKKNMLSHTYRGSIVTFLAWGYNSRETALFQTTESVKINNGINISYHY